MLGRVAIAAGMVFGLVMLATTALAGTPGTSPGNGSFVGGVTFPGPEPLVLWNLPGAGRLGTCIDANVNGPLTGPYQRQDTINDALYAELNHIYANSATSDVQLAELSALNSARYDLVDKSVQWGYVQRGQGGLSVSDADAMLAKARAFAGPYTVSVSWPTTDTQVNVAYQATITVRAAAGGPVPIVRVNLTGTNVALAASSAMTNSAGVAVIGFQIPPGSSSTATIGATVAQWTTLDRYRSSSEQTMLVTGAQGSASGSHTAPVTRTRDVKLVKVDAADPAKTPVAGYVFRIEAADGTVLKASLTSASTPVDIGTLPIGATYRVTELSAPPGGSLYIPSNATTTFTVPDGTGEWTVVEGDPKRPTPSVQTQVTLEDAMPGQRLSDRVTVGGDDGEHGLITATLYGPVPIPRSGQCSDLDLAAYRAAPARKFSAAVTGNGVLTVRGPVVSLPGCYGWSESLTLSPSGVTVVSRPTAPHESSVVTVPAVRTTVSAQVAMPGTTLHDTAVVTGLASPADLVATLYGPLPADKVAGCVGYSATDWRDAVAHAKSGLVAGRSRVKIDGDGRYDVGSVRVRKPGCYTYVETLAPIAAGVSPVRTAAGQAAESTVVIAPVVGTVATPSAATPGGLLRDIVTVRGTSGVPATITGRLLGPVPSSGGSCAGLDWAHAAVVGVITPLIVHRDGRYITAPIRVRKPGCYTFVESLKTPSLPGPIASTHPGERPETVLVSRPATPLAATGVPVDGWLLAGISLLGVGLVAFALGSLRRGWVG